MRNKSFQFVKNFSYAILSNLVSLIISTLVVLVVPRIIGIKDYGYWQLYVFYSSYVGFLHLGWSDGIYLRYGGDKYNDLNKQVFSLQFYLMLISQLVLSGIFIIIILFFVKNLNSIYIYIMVAVNIVIVNVLSFFLLTLQATNRIRDYAVITLVSRCSYIAIMIFLIVFSINNYKWMVLADVLGKSLSLLYAVFLCKDIVLEKSAPLTSGLAETFENIHVGIKLMFANIASMLIIGVVRFGIEKVWDVSTFGKVSLTLSVSNLLMIFINAVGIVIFPVIKRMEQNKLSKLYSAVRDILIVVLSVTLFLYFPLRLLLSKWLPDYSDSIKYMALIFPISLYEGKMGLLINPFLKAFRKENYIMKINTFVFLLSVLMTFVTTVILENLIFAILTILLVIVLRCILAELFLSNVLNINIVSDISMELIITICFVVIGWNTSSIFGAIVYLFLLLIIFLKKKSSINDSWRILTGLIKDN